MSQPSEGVVAYGYDVNGYMDSLTDWRCDTIAMTNDPDGRMETVGRVCWGLTVPASDQPLAPLLQGPNWC